MSLRDNFIYLPALLMDMSTGSAILGVTFFASRLGASPLTIGVMASINTVLYVLLCQVFGKLSDRSNRKRFPQIACFSFAVLYLFMPFCTSLKQLIIFFPLTGVTLSALWPAMEAWIGEQGDGRSLVKRVSMFNLFWTGGLMLGYVSGGYIYDLNVSAPFYFAGIFALCSTVIISIQPGPANGAREGLQVGRPSDMSQLSLNRQLAAKYLNISRVANFASWLTLGIMRYIFPKLIYEMGVAPRVFGLLMLCQAGAQFVMFFVLGTTEKWHYRFSPLLVFQILAVISFASIWLVGSPVLWAFALMLFGLNTGMTYSSSMYYSLCGHLDLGGKSAWHESVIHTGVFFSTLIGGALANYVDLKSPYLFCAAAILVGLPVQIFILRRNNNESGRLRPCP